MKTIKLLSNQEVMVVTGKLVVASRRELADLMAQSGYKYVYPEHSKFSVFVVACDPSGADIVKAKSMDAAILTERQFLDRLPAPALIERAQAEASDPTTSKKRLTELAAVVPEAVAQNPLWQVLHLENPSFLDHENGLLRLRLLRLAPEVLLEEFFAESSDTPISVDVYAANGVTFGSSDSQSLSKAFQIDEYSITIHCSDLDASMENVGLACEERLSIGDAIRGYLMSPFDDLQEIAEGCGVTNYDMAWSPRNGSPMRLGGICVESEADLFEYEWDSLPEDQELIDRLVESEDGKYRGISVVDVGERRPLFGSPPVGDEDMANEGVIGVRWDCDCFLPVSGSGDDGEDAGEAWSKLRLSECLTFTGTAIDDYTVDYEYVSPIELEGEIAKDIHHSSSISAALNACLLSVLGLRSDDLTD